MPYRDHPRRRARAHPVLVAVLSAACASEESFGPLPVTATVSLAPGQYVVLADTAARGAVEFPAAGASGAEYLVVGQLGTGTPDLTAEARLGAQAAAQAERVTVGVYRAAPGPAELFHGMLRRREAALAREAWRFRDLLLAPARTPPPTVGSTRTFKVCSNLQCDRTTNVPATAQWVGQRAAIFVDDSAPAGGFTTADLDAIGTQFDTVLYPIDTLAFGRESDIDGNGVLLVLLTRQVNALVGRPQCEESFITGFFYGGDLAPGFAQQFNNGEVFYGMVPDPNGQVSCARSVALVRNLLPVTFVHEFQHMISFNQHVLVRGGAGELLWVNEALSHLAEELAGLHYDSLGLRATGRRFHIGNQYNGFVYLRGPARHPLVTDDPPGSLESRGAGWLFLRWLADQYGAGLPRQLVATVNLGATNVEAATGTPLGTLLGRWALALYAHDLPGFAAPAELQFAFWRLRATYDSLHQSFPADFTVAFPLEPVAALPGNAAVSGLVASGSGHFLRVTQPPGAAAFLLTFRPVAGGALPENRRGQIAVLRVR
jgi:hypothetical protein